MLLLLLNIKDENADFINRVKYSQHSFILMGTLKLINIFFLSGSHHNNNIHIFHSLYVQYMHLVMKRSTKNTYF